MPPDLRKIRGTLGRLDHLQPGKSGLIEHLHKLASAEGRLGVRLREMRILASRDYGIALAARQLWEEMRLAELLGAAGGQSGRSGLPDGGERGQRAQSKLALVDHHG